MRYFSLIVLFLWLAACSSPSSPNLSQPNSSTGEELDIEPIDDTPPVDGEQAPPDQVPAEQEPNEQQIVDGESVEEVNQCVAFESFAIPVTNDGSFPKAALGDTVLALNGKLYYSVYSQDVVETVSSRMPNTDPQCRLQRHLYSFNPADASFNSLYQSSPVQAACFGAEDEGMDAIDNTIYFQGGSDTQRPEIYALDTTRADAAQPVAIADNSSVIDDGAVSAVITSDQQHIIVTSRSGGFLATSNNAALRSDRSSLSIAIKDDWVYYSDLVVGGGNELYRANLTDGRNEYFEVLEGGFGANPVNLTVFDNTIYFSGNYPLASFELLRLDPLTSTIELMADITADDTGSYPAGFQILDDVLYFTGKSEATGSEIFSFNPNPNFYGWSVVSDISPSGFGSPELADLVTMDGRLYFSADDGVSGRELWAYDPVSQETALITDLNPGSESGDPTKMTPFDNKLYFHANDGSGTALWAFDPDCG